MIDIRRNVTERLCRACAAATRIVVWVHRLADNATEIRHGNVVCVKVRLAYRGLFLVLAATPTVTKQLVYSLVSFNDSICCV